VKAGILKVQKSNAFHRCFLDSAMNPIFIHFAAKITRKQPYISARILFSHLIPSSILFAVSLLCCFSFLERALPEGLL
jgi:hypothetical protein